MNKEEDYASDTDESDEDFQPDNLAGESAASEDPDDSEDNEEGPENVETSNSGKLKKRKRTTKKSNTKKKSKTKDEDDETDEELDNGKDVLTARRATRQTEDLNANGKGKTIEKDELESDDEDKTRTNALWADFLKDVKPEAAATKPTPPKSNSTKTNDKPSSSSSSNGKDHTEKTQAIANEIKAQSSNDTKETNTKTVVTEIVDFAGEEVRIQREVDAASVKENKASATHTPKLQPFGRIMPGAGGLKRLSNPPGAGGSSAGLGSFLNQLGKKKKISVLEKSQMDWKNFKQDEGIDEQLQTFNKGKDG